MAKQDEWVRITLRLPQELHLGLSEAAGAASLNAEIVSRLEESLAESRSRQEYAADFDKLAGVSGQDDTLDKAMAAAIGVAVRNVLASYGHQTIDVTDEEATPARVEPAKRAPK